MRAAGLFALVMAFGACSDEDMKSGLPPWHMWGNSITEELVTTSLLPFPKDTQQILRVSYGRPETWRLFFAAQIVDGDTAVTGGDLIVDFTITIGVGRTSFELRNAPRFQFNWPNAVPIGTQIYSTTIDGPIKDGAFPDRPNVIETLVAQDIQARADFLFVGNNPAGGDRVKVQTTAMFVPNVHIRPEWFTRVGEFPGNEQAGR